MGSVLAFGCLAAFAVAAYDWMDSSMPFRGMLSKEMYALAHKTDFSQVVLSWLPAWWVCMALSFMSAGVALGCSIWATVAGVSDQPYGTPILIGAASLVTAFAGLVIPLAQAFYKDRSENRALEATKARIKELERLAETSVRGHARNAEDLQKVAEVTRRIVECTPGIDNDVLDDVTDKKEGE